MIKLKRIKEKEIRNVIYNNDNFVDRIKSIQLSLFSSEEIESLSFGEVKTPETIHYKTHVPIENGLYCQKIFGPVRDWACGCGKYVGKMFKNVTCGDCGVKVNSNSSRRERIGHIKLSTPVIHSWYYLGNHNNYISVLLDTENKNVVEIIYYERFIILDKDFEKNFKIHTVSRSQFDHLEESEKEKALSGVEGISTILNSLDLNKLLEYLQSKSKKTESKRIGFIKHILEEKTDIKRIIINALPVLPCDLRPIIPLNNGILGTTDINHLYRLVILRNNRIKILKAIKVPEIILRHSKIILQKAVDALFDNNRLKKPIKSKERNLKSIADELSGKQGILRANLLGKRVDFSARSVIVIDPELKLSECAIPIEMAAELFKLEITRKLLQLNDQIGLNEAIDKVESLSPDVITILREIIKNRSILLNRAPTLHRNSLQAFDIKLTEGRAIKIHPLICEGFNADFDGDLMAVYLSILPSTIIESKILINVVNNIFSFANGNAIVRPIREILMGCYYSTLYINKANEYKHVIKNIKDVIKLYENKALNIHDKIKVVINNELVDTTTGRVLINECLPIEQRNYNIIFDKKFIEKITIEISDNLGNEKTADILDKIKDFGFCYATKEAISLSLEDMIVPKNKQNIVDITTKKSLEIKNLISKKLMTNEEGRNQNIQNWSAAIENLKKDMQRESDEGKTLNDLFVSVNSGARGSIDQPRQLSIMRGLVADTTGKIVDYPVTSSYKDGLVPIEYFISSFGSRKGVVDRALRTASAGYLTRKLVVLNSGSFITEHDCETKDGMIYEDLLDENNKLLVSKFKRLFGRTIVEDVLEWKAGTILNEKHIDILKEKNICPKVRTLFTCKSDNICSLCYGMDLARRSVVSIGSPVGIIAAQSIGEPALQLTMRTFHTGGASLTNENKSLVFASKDGEIKEITADLIEISSDETSFYRYLVKEKGHINLEGEILQIDKGDLISVVKGQKLIKGEVVYTKNTQSEVFFSENEGKILLLDGKINQINGESVVTSVAKNASFSIGDETQLIPNNSVLFFKIGQFIKKGDLLAKCVHLKSVSQDIIDSLKHVEHIIELRKTKDADAIITPAAGTFDYEYVIEKFVQPFIMTEKGEKILLLPSNKSCSVESLVVEKGDILREGQKITFGLIDYNKILNVFSPDKAMIFMLNEIKAQYIKRNISLDDKHLEIVIKRMFSFATITKSNSYKFIQGTTYPIENIKKFNNTIENEEDKIIYSIKCLGITKSCLNSTSFISATSFQNTRNLLAHAAFFNQKDNLTGIEENVLVGNPIPAGTGMKENVDKVFCNITKEDKKLPLSLFLKKINPFFFVNMCLEVLDEKNQEDVDFIEKNSNWLEEVIEETKDKIIQNLSL